MSKESNKDSEDAVNKVRKASDRKNSAVRRVAQAADTGDKRDRSFSSRLGFPAIVGVVTLLGLILVIFAWTTRDPLAQPATGKDHWHAIYGVYDCSLNDGDGGYLPAFLSDVDPDGIHSHGDGIIHIHPWADRSDGPDARLAIFFEAMQVRLDDDQMVLDSGQILTEGVDCNGEPAVLQVLEWQFWFDALAGDNPKVITESLDQVQFKNDRQVFVIALAPEGTDIPLPPQERFDLLEDVAPIVQSSGPVESQQQTFNVPAPDETAPAGDDPVDAGE